MKTVKQISVTDFRRHFHPALAAVWLGHSRLELHRHGVAVAALVSMDDLKRLESLEGTSVAREKARRARDWDRFMAAKRR